MSDDPDTCLPTTTRYLFSEENELLSPTYRRGDPEVGVQIDGSRRFETARVLSFSELRATCAMRRFRMVVPARGWPMPKNISNVTLSPFPTKKGDRVPSEDHLALLSDQSSLGPSLSLGPSSSGSCPMTLQFSTKLTSTWLPSPRRTSTP